MKYKGRVVRDFSIGVESWGEKVGEILTQNNIRWSTCENVAGDLVIVTPVTNTFESINTLFLETSKHFKASIHVLYEEFDSNGHNLEEFNEVLDVNLLELPVWTYDYPNIEVWREGHFLYTKEQAIVAGRIFAKNEGLLSFQVGRQVEVTPVGIDTDSVLENIAENLQSEVVEVADDYLLDVTKEHQEELEEKLNEVLFDWMKKNNYEPTFYTIEDVEEIAM